MKRYIALLCTVFLIFSCAIPAYASNFYMIPDSNTRRLTREELWTWQYDALGYILNEIFARHGYHFEPGKKYDNFFRAQAWYRENPIYDNQGIYANLMTNIEWANERLVKEVRAEMKALGTTNEGGKRLPAVAFEPEMYGAFSQFQKVYFAPDQKLPVYSGPGTHYHRSANGKALASTNGSVYVGGWENGWLMIMYWTNDYNVRVGFTQRSNFKDNIDVPHLYFDYVPATITQRTPLTDDPVASFQPMATLEAGTQVTYLSEFFNERHWVYVETTVSGVQMRGFVEAGTVSLLSMEADEPSYAPAEVVAEVEAPAAPAADSLFEPVVGPSSAADGAVEHSLWGLSSSSTVEDVQATLEGKSIQHEREDSQTSAFFINSKEGQSITMFGIPVQVQAIFRGEALYSVDIRNAADWTLSGAEPQSDAVIQQAIEAYTTMLQASDAQYGPATGGYLQTYDKEHGPRWSYPMKDGQPDYETVLSALEKDRYAALHTRYNNLDVKLIFNYDASPAWAYVGLGYAYSSDLHAGENVNPLSFTLPEGPYTGEAGAIEIGF